MCKQFLKFIASGGHVPTLAILIEQKSTFESPLGMRTHFFAMVGNLRGRCRRCGAAAESEPPSYSVSFSTRGKEVMPLQPITPERVLDELACIARLDAELPDATLAWTEAVVGRADRIIPPANQLTAWHELGTPVLETDDAHYQETLFNHYLQDRWTNA